MEITETDLARATQRLYEAASAEQGIQLHMHMTEKQALMGVLEQTLGVLGITVKRNNTGNRWLVTRTHEEDCVSCEDAAERAIDYAIMNRLVSGYWTVLTPGIEPGISPAVKHRATVERVAEQIRVVIRK